MVVAPPSAARTRLTLISRRRSRPGTFRVAQERSETPRARGFAGISRIFRGLAHCKAGRVAQALQATKQRKQQAPLRLPALSRAPTAVPIYLHERAVRVRCRVICVCYVCVCVCTCDFLCATLIRDMTTQPQWRPALRPLRGP